MLEQVTTALQQLKTQGSFFAKMTPGADDLQIEITPVGKLKFPLKRTVIKELIKVAQPATFGWQDKTCLDTEVRDVWKIPRSRVKIDKRRWNRTLHPVLETLKHELGLPDESKLRAELHDALIYAPGQFFLPHQDSEKCDGMIATLVVVLPSPHRGGALIVDHQGEKKRFQSSRITDDKLGFVAFYADCHHEVRPVTEGYRVALTYNLTLKGGDQWTAPSAGQDQQAVVDALHGYFTIPPADDKNAGNLSKKLVYLLDHEYTARGLSWATLKNADLLRGGSLLEAASTLGLELHLALADCQEIWDCEYDEPDWGYRSRRRYWDEEEEDSGAGEPELVELIDETTLIKHWRDASGKPIKLPQWNVDGRQLCWTCSNSELKPFESEYEGWMGNYGNSMERWYHRAAIVLWRREERHAALLAIAPQVMVQELLQLAQKKATLPSAQESIRHLLPYWSGLGHRDVKASSFNQIFRLALRVDNTELAHGLLLPLGIEAFRTETVKTLTRLHGCYGNHWLIGVFQHWFEHTTYPTVDNMIKGLSPMIRIWVESAPNEHLDLTHWLLAHQLDALRQKHLQESQQQSPASFQEAASDRTEALIDLLSASLTGLDEGVFNDTLQHLMNDENCYMASDLVTITRYLKQQRRESTATEISFLEFVRDTLKRLLDHTPRQRGNWSIMQTWSCDCADCQVLREFLQSRLLDHKIWPLGKERRQHIHRIIESLGVPVNHQTEHSGSPHKLHLNKTKQLFLDDKAQRRDLKKAMAELGN